MQLFSPTPEQNAVISHSDECFVEACPGAGKTNTIVARVGRVLATLPPRRGVAILSYTNSAVEELRERLVRQGHSAAASFPNFLGTVDAFVRHFFVLPGGIAMSTERPVVVDSWRTLGIEVRIPGKRQSSGASLDYFDAKSGIVDLERISHDGLRRHVAEFQSKYEDEARRCRQALHKNGHISAGDARYVALDLIETTDRAPALARAIAARFAEVIVDEAQDCNPSDLKLLQWLRNAGVRVLVICDPDQAIYEFRDGDPAHLSAFADTFAEPNRKSLTGNFRSCSPICGVAATLRSNHSADLARSTLVNPHPIVVLPYSGNQPTATVTTRFLQHLGRVQPRLETIRVLAHARATALRAIGVDPGSASAGSSRLANLALAQRDYQGIESDHRQRSRALVTVERLILALAGRANDKNEHPERAVQRDNLSARTLRTLALRFVSRLPVNDLSAADGRKAWVGAVRRRATELELEIASGVTLKSFFRDSGNLPGLSATAAPQAHQRITASTIHEVKGREFDAVCLVMPARKKSRTSIEDLIAAWEERTASEAKRVLYVGATRAKRFLMLAVPAHHHSRVVKILEENTVPHVALDLNGEEPQARLFPLPHVQAR